MDQDDGAFFVDPEQQEVRQIVQLEQANPIYTKTMPQQKQSITLKMIDIPKPQAQFNYQPFRIKAQQQQSDGEQQNDEFCFLSPFTQFYSKQQMIYRRFNNQFMNRLNEVTYFCGSFVQKNVLLGCNKQQAESIVDLLKDDYQIKTDNIENQQNQLVFDSDFQSGNLFAAFKIADREYDLVMQNDLNSCGNNQWFYFSVIKLQVGVQYTFNVVNFTKNDSLFNYGMTPVAYSTVANKRNLSQWFRIGHDVVYKKGKIPRQNSRRYYYCLTFKFTWKHTNDKAYFAHSYPYTYSKLLNKIHSVQSAHQDLVTKICVGKTLSKKNIQGIIITQKSKNKKDSRKAIVVMARQHPGETQGSFVCDGVIDKLLQKSKQGDFIRKNFVVYVIPMVNPDGVIFGHYRTNLSGKDLNRKWDSTEKEVTCPQVTSIKAFLVQVSKSRQIRFILDLHGHSKKLNSFFYGNPYPQNPQHVRIFPYMCAKLNCAVQFMDCTFSAQQYKRKAARVYLSYMFKQIQVYTFESSFYGFFREGKKQQFTVKQYQNLGHTLVQALYSVLQNDCKQSKKDSFFAKSMQQLKNNKQLLEVGNQIQSGSDSKPEQGELNEVNIPKMSLSEKKSFVQTPVMTQNVRKSQKRTSSRKGNREPPQVRQLNRPTRNLRFLQISRVNSVLPDKYQFGLQPIKRKQQSESQMSRTQSSILKINSHCQTDMHEVFEQLQQKEIQQCGNLSNSVKFQQRNNSSKKFSSVIKNTNRHNNIIFRIDFLNQRSTSTSLKQKEQKVLFNAFSQTIVTFKRKNTQRIRSSQLFPSVQSPDSDRRNNRINNIKYNSSKIGVKKQAQIFLNGMVKKYLIQKDTKMRQNSVKIVQRPLSIKKKHIYHK